MKTEALLRAVALVIVAGALLAGGCSQTDTGGDGTTVTDSLVVLMVAGDSVSVLELTREQHTVESRGTAMGIFVTAIDSVEAGGGAYWVYSVNGSTPDVAADRFIVGPGDTVRWHFRKGR